MSELKPCPFCGGKTQVCWTSQTEEHTTISCVSCEASSRVCLDLSQAILVWNNRTADNDPPPSEGRLPVIAKALNELYNFPCELEHVRSFIPEEWCTIEACQGNNVAGTCWQKWLEMVVKKEESK